MKGEEGERMEGESRRREVGGMVGPEGPERELNTWVGPESKAGLETDSVLILVKMQNVNRLTLHPQKEMGVGTVEKRQEQSQPRIRVQKRFQNSWV